MKPVVAILVSAAWVIHLAAGALSLSTAVARAEIVIDSPMEIDPPLDRPPMVLTLPGSFKALWFQALAGPDSELRMRAAEAVARSRTHGSDEMSDAAPHLLRALGEEGATLPVRLSLARALIVVEARDAAPALFAQAERGELEMRQLVEPALAEWGFTPARAVWLARLKNDETPQPLLALSIRCLGIVQTLESVTPLQTLVEAAATPPGVRLEAARVLGTLRVQGLEATAERLAARSGEAGVPDRLAAVSLVRLHEGERAVALLTTLALDEQPAVAVIALQRLLDIDPAIVLPLVGRTIANRDATVRRLAAEALFSVPSVASVERLEPLLDDRHPDVRGYVRESLFQLAGGPELSGPVRAAAMRQLNGAGWRGLEQAAMLLGALDHKPAAERLLALLEHKRPEVIVSSAWALRRLGLPETLPPMLAVAERRTDQSRRGIQIDGVDRQLSQIFQAFATARFYRADGLLREYVPKTGDLGVESRAAAVWALGYLHEGSPDASLVTQFQERLRDVASTPPESEPVRRMSATSLGRMKAEDSLPALREYYSPRGAIDEVDGACNWAITQITGEMFPEAGDREFPEADWFLVPL